MRCLKRCKLRGYNAVHNDGECYYNAPECLQRDIDKDCPDLALPQADNKNEEAEDGAIEDPSLP